MPEGYCKTLIRQTGQHAHSALLVSCPKATGSPAPPRRSTKRFCLQRRRMKGDTTSVAQQRRRGSAGMN
jgi:hypothetical protein